MTYRPRLRSSVRVERIELPSGGVALKLLDPPAGTRVHVDPALAPALALLDGTRELEQVLAAPVPPDWTRRLLLSLAFSGLLEGIDDGARTGLVEARATGPSITQDLPFQLVLGSRFACGGCGECCRGYSPGPITTEEMARIQTAKFVRDDAELRSRPLFVVRATEDGRGGISPPTYHLNRTDAGECVFLMKDNRCRIHAELGAEAKPDVCKLFPWTVTPTPRGIVVSDRTECSTFARSSAEGPPLEQRFAEVRALFRRKASGGSGLFSPSVVLPGPIAIGWARFRGVVERLVEILQRDEGPDVFARVEACRDVIALFGALVARARPEPGEPERVQAELEAIPAADLVALAPAKVGLAPDPAAFDGALVRLAERLLPYADRFVHEWDARRAGGAFPIEAVLPLEMALVFREGLEVLARKKRPSAKLDAGDAVVMEALRRGALQRVHGLEMEGETRASAGWSRTAFTLLAVVACARVRATARGATTVSAEDFDRGQVAAVRGLAAPTVRDGFHAEPADLDAFFANAARLLERANA